LLRTFDYRAWAWNTLGTTTKMARVQSHFRTIFGQESPDSLTGWWLDDETCLLRTGLDRHREAQESLSQSHFTRRREPQGSRRRPPQMPSDENASLARGWGFTWYTREGRPVPRPSTPPRHAVSPRAKGVLRQPITERQRPLANLSSHPAIFPRNSIFPCGCLVSLNDPHYLRSSAQIIT
jgi:hypothetical protein